MEKADWASKLQNTRLIKLVQLSKKKSNKLSIGEKVGFINYCALFIVV